MENIVYFSPNFSNNSLSFFLCFKLYWQCFLQSFPSLSCWLTNMIIWMIALIIDHSRSCYARSAIPRYLHRLGNLIIRITLWSRYYCSFPLILQMRKSRFQGYSIPIWEFVYSYMRTKEQRETRIKENWDSEKSRLPLSVLIYT